MVAGEATKTHKKDISGSHTFILRLWMKNISWRLGDYTVSLEDSVEAKDQNF